MRLLLGLIQICVTVHHFITFFSLMYKIGVVIQVSNTHESDVPSIYTVFYKFG